MNTNRKQVLSWKPGREYLCFLHVKTCQHILWDICYCFFLWANYSHRTFYIRDEPQEKHWIHLSNFRIFGLDDCDTVWGKCNRKLPTNRYTWWWHSGMGLFLATGPGKFVFIDEIMNEMCYLNILRKNIKVQINLRPKRWNLHAQSNQSNVVRQLYKCCENSLTSHLI